MVKVETGRDLSKHSGRARCAEYGGDMSTPTLPALTARRGTKEGAATSMQAEGNSSEIPNEQQGVDTQQ